HEIDDEAARLADVAERVLARLLPLPPLDAEDDERRGMAEDVEEAERRGIDPPCPVAARDRRDGARQHRVDEQLVEVPFRQVGGRDVHGRHRASARSSSRTAAASARAPVAACSGSIHSSGAWLRPSRHGTKIMPMGPTRETNMPSWPAPLGMARWLRPSPSAARAIAARIGSAQGVGGTWLMREDVALTPSSASAGATAASSSCVKAATAGSSPERTSRIISTRPGTALAAFG